MHVLVCYADRLTSPLLMLVAREIFRLYPGIVSHFQVCSG